MPEIKYRKLDPACTHLRITTTHGEKFRRFGHEFSSLPKLVEVKALAPWQVKELLREPRTFYTARREDAKLPEKLLLRVEQVAIDRDGSQRMIDAVEEAETAPPQGIPPEVMAEIRREFSALQDRVAEAEKRAAAAEKALADQASAGDEKPAEGKAEKPAEGKAEKPAGKGKSK